MKSVRTLITISLLLTAATLFAQIENRPLMKVNIPFAFSVNGQSLPAGQYFINSVTPERALRVATTDGKHSMVVNALPSYSLEPSENSRLVFHRYGDQYFLTEVWTAGDTLTRKAINSKKAIQIASNGSQPETKVILADAAH